MAKRRFTSQFLYGFEAMPVLLNCNFIVDAANGNGLGLRSLKGEGISAVYMHTSSTPAAGSPNPAAGIIMVQLQDSYFRSLGGFNSIVAPLSGSSVTSSVANVANTITVLGTATLAQWQAVGLPAGITPAVGVSFIATSSALIGGSGAIQITVAAGSGITNIESVGNPSVSVAVTSKLQPPLPPVGPQSGGLLLLRCMKNAVLTAPTDGTVISLSFLLSNSSVTVAGQ